MRQAASSQLPPPLSIQDQAIVVPTRGLNLTPTKLLPTRKDHMDPVIWSKLPGELLEHVLSFLPLKTFLNLRSTCKHFRSLVFSPPFISRHSPSSSSSSSSSPTSSPFSSFLLLSHPQFHPKFQLYDSFLGCWRNLSLSLALSNHGGAGQPDIGQSQPPSPSSSSSPSYSALLSSSNGLLCFSLASSGSFLVLNPLAKSSTVIQFPSFPFSFESFSFASTPSSGYKILILCRKFNSNSGFLYDSITRSWTESSAVEMALSDSFHQEGVLFKGSLYFATPEPFSVVCFDVETRGWSNLDTELPRELTFVRLVSDHEEGKLYLVGGVGSNGISRSMRLWELEEGKGRDHHWIEVESLPEMMCKKFLSVCYHNYDHVYCFWHQGMICLCCYNWPEILYYKVSRRTWHWLPRCPSLPQKWSCGFKWFSFVPDLYVSAV